MPVNFSSLEAFTYTVDAPLYAQTNASRIAEQREAARSLVTEYLSWVAGVARSNYGLSFDIDSMVRSDIENPSKFHPPSGRFYLVVYEYATSASAA